MLAFFALALQFCLILAKVIGLSTLGWFGTFMPAIIYAGFVVSIYGILLGGAVLVGAVALVSSWRNR